jgi:leucyl/phenylalanyl-tRNA---protein transferase
MEHITPEQLLHAYANGYFPMAEGRNCEELLWFYPQRRGIIPLETFHIPKSLSKFLRHSPYHFTIDTCFPEVIKACAEVPRSHEKGTWINATIEQLYTELWAYGFAHSVECWEGNTLVGGLYGVSLGGAFFGESMFSIKSNASRCCLVYLVAILKEAGYTLLDTQYVNEHLKQFGVIDISRKDYLDKLEYALNASDNPSSRFSTAGGNILNNSMSPES